MLQLISRTEVFRRSPIADRCISSGQQEEHERLRGKKTICINNQTMRTGDVYDHLQPFHKNARELDDFAVLTYDAKYRTDYAANCPFAFGQFCKLLGIPKLYLLDELKYDWMLHFPFGYSIKRDQFKTMLNLPEYYGALEVDIDNLPTVLPLFFFSNRWGQPVIYIFPSGSSADLLIFICNDGNFHMGFPATDRELISGAAAAAGLKMGGIEICNNKRWG